MILGNRLVAAGCSCRAGSVATDIGSLPESTGRVVAIQLALDYDILTRLVDQELVEMSVGDSPMRNGKPVRNRGAFGT